MRPDDPFRLGSLGREFIESAKILAEPYEEKIAALRARLAEVEAERDALRRTAVADRNLCYEAVAYLEDLLAGVEVVEDAARACSARLAALGDRLAKGQR